LDTKELDSSMNNTTSNQNLHYVDKESKEALKKLYAPESQIKQIVEGNKKNIFYRNEGGNLISIKSLITGSESEATLQSNFDNKINPMSKSQTNSNTS
jgi:hypothetical protein